MAIVEIRMPKMGESVVEGTILKWLKSVGDTVTEDESLLEVGTDKVDTEIPSPKAGTITEFLYNEGDVVEIGTPIAKIDTNSEEPETKPIPTPEKKGNTNNKKKEAKEASIPGIEQLNKIAKSTPTEGNANNGFYSPLVLSIAKKEGISIQELQNVKGSGLNNRVTKKDILGFITNKSNTPVITEEKVETTPNTTPISKPSPQKSPVAKSITGEYDIIEMSRMRQMIAERMLESTQIAPHVTSFVEADVTNVVYWRNRWKTHFKEKENVALTLTPIFIEAVIKALKDYPMMNVSVEGNKIYVKKDINIGIAVALPDGNLIVPVVHNADQYNLVGLTKKVNDLAKRARQNKLSPDELQGGTYTISNMGSFGNVMGTPILVQPQVGILALGAVQKKPAVIETPQGDTIGIRQMMFLSHSYDHRVVDGSLGGMFVRKVADYLDNFDLDRKI